MKEPVEEEELVEHDCRESSLQEKIFWSAVLVAIWSAVYWITKSLPRPHA
jgi:hypothetical protein